MDPVRQETPGSRVSLGGKQIAPILADQPRAEEGRDFGAARQFPEFGHSADEQKRKYEKPQRELVDAKATDVDTRTKAMPFQAQHGDQATSRRLAIDELGAQAFWSISQRRSS